MMYADTGLYAPYGAFELKAYYQRNLLIGNALVFTFVGLVALLLWLLGALNQVPLVTPPADRVIGVIHPMPPPSIAKPNINAGAKPPGGQVRGAIPVPSADSMADGIDTVTIPSPHEFGQSYGPDADSGGVGVGQLQIDPSRGDDLGDPPDFQPLEIFPEMIHNEKPAYPHIAVVTGQTGVVWVKALVDKEGNVVKAMVARSSTYQLLDEAAVAAAYKNKFKPGIQNGFAVRCWVVYKVSFALDEEH